MGSEKNEFNVAFTLISRQSWMLSLQIIDNNGLLLRGILSKGIAEGICFLDVRLCPERFISTFISTHPRNSLSYYPTVLKPTMSVRQREPTKIIFRIVTQPSANQISPHCSCIALSIRFSNSPKLRSNGSFIGRAHPFRDTTRRNLPPHHPLRR